MDKRQAVESAMASVEMEGFVFTEEEKALFSRYANGEISDAELYRIISDKLPPGAVRPKIAITTCGHHPNVTHRKNLPRKGDKIKCEACNGFTIVTDVVK